MLFFVVFVFFLPFGFKLVIKDQIMGWRQRISYNKVYWTANVCISEDCQVNSILIEIDAANISRL